jgi:anion-transporting  ArsA/GET3 family ATPase
MLDTKSTFDSVVARYAGDDEQAERILSNRFYRNISGALSGTQEYMAMEKLYELQADDTFDLVVVDTPPTRHALDFLDAPRNLTRLLDHRLYRVLTAPTRGVMKAVNKAAVGVIRSVSKVVGAEVFDDAIAFFQAFEGMEEGFRQRAGAVLAILDDPRTAFVLVASPRRDTVDEARFFADRLASAGIPVGALVVNRVHPRFSEQLPHRFPGGRPPRGAGRADRPRARGPGAVPALRRARPRRPHRDRRLPLPARRLILFACSIRGGGRRWRPGRRPLLPASPPRGRCGRSRWCAAGG